VCYFSVKNGGNTDKDIDVDQEACRSGPPRNQKSEYGILNLKASKEF
jgi:hypothetical protein